MRHNTQLLLLISASLIALCALACDTPADGGGACDDDDGCESGSCERGVCQGLCPCEEGWECIQERNVLGWPTSTCVKPCSADSGCPSEWHCDRACPAPFNDPAYSAAGNYSCADDQSALVCEPDRPLKGAITADKPPSQHLRTEPVTFTLHMLHSGRGAIKKRWKVNDAAIPASADEDSVTVEPIPGGGSVTVVVELTDDADHSAAVVYHSDL